VYGLKQLFVGGAAAGLGRQRVAATHGGRPVEELELGGDVALRIDGEGGQAAGVRRRSVAGLSNGVGVAQSTASSASRGLPVRRWVVGNPQAGPGPATLVVVVAVVVVTAVVPWPLASATKRLCPNCQATQHATQSARFCIGKERCVDVGCR